MREAQIERQLWELGRAVSQPSRLRAHAQAPRAFGTLARAEHGPRRTTLAALAHASTEQEGPGRAQPASTAGPKAPRTAGEQLKQTAV
jgi:hypothetical protein